MKIWKNKLKFGHSSLLVVALLALVTLGISGRKIKGKKDAYKELERLTDVLVLIENNYVEEIKVDDLFLGAIRGMMGTLDSHSSFMPPDIYKEMQVETRGKFGGLGIEITIRDRRLIVVSPIEDTPAFKAGIKALDWIVKVDGKPTQDMTLMEAVKQMRGEKGTKVTISIMRKGFREPKDFPIVRDIIRLRNITSRLEDENIGYIKIRQFQERTVDELKNSIKKQQEKGAQAFIIDLRNNPGGLLDQAIAVSDFFLDKGKLVVSTKGRLKSQNKEFRSTTQPTDIDYPLVVLVNAGSASASEIVAGAIQDWNRGVILGVKTFGKGSVQTVIPLSNGAGLRLTTAHYYTPHGTNIHAKGIVPDILVDDTSMILDKIAERKKEQKIHMLREKDLRQFPNDEKKKEEIDKEKQDEVDESEPTVKEEEESEIKDVQLERAKEIIRATLIFSKYEKGPSVAQQTTE
jgi:carboxyl-terminal processing protease